MAKNRPNWQNKNIKNSKMKFRRKEKFFKNCLKETKNKENFQKIKI